MAVCYTHHYETSLAYKPELKGRLLFLGGLRGPRSGHIGHNLDDFL